MDVTPELLKRHQAGDNAALDELLADILPWLHREVSRSMGNQPRISQDSMDLVQTAVQNYLAWGPRFLPKDGAQFRALLRRIALNELVDHQRRATRTKEGKHLDSLGTASNPLSGFAGPSLSSLQPAKAAEKREEEEWVRLALQFLSLEDRQLVLASEVAGLDWATIASELRLPSPDAARVRAARLKPKLANLLRQLKASMLPPVPDE
jgi:RNA polymerase sigma factor (sigma-70 family)